jgi:hypothetical protein
VTSADFCGNGDFLVTRDYLSVRKWDRRNTEEACETIIKVSDPDLSFCYEKERIFDRHFVSCNKSQSAGILTAGYGKVMHLINGENDHLLSLTGD